MDDYWPAEARGFIVGKVVSVEDDPSDPTLRKRAVVRPIRPLDSLSRVTIVLPPSPQDSQPAADGRAVRPRP
jgi:hypothetical protein